MAWAFRAAGAVSTGASPTPALPTGWQTNDLLLIVATSGATFSTAPTGYTQIALHSASPFLTIWYKFAVAGETAKQVVNTNTATAAVVLAYSGVSIYDTVSTVATASSTTLATNTLTTAATNELVLSIYGGAVSASATRAWTPPTGPTNRVSQSRTTSTTGMCISDINQTSAGTSTSYTVTTAQTAALAAYTVAFKQSQTFTQAVTTTPITTTSTFGNKTLGKILSYTEITINSFTRFINKTISNIVTNLVTISKGNNLTQLLTTSISNTVTYSRSINRTLSRLVTGTISVIKSIPKAISVTKTIVVSLLKSSVPSIILTSVVNVTGVINKRYPKLLLSIATSTINLLQAIKRLKTITATVNSSILLLRAKTILKIITTTAVSVLTSLVTAKIKFQQLLAYVSSSVTSKKDIRKILTITVNYGIILYRAIKKLLSIVSSVIVSFISFVTSFTNYPVDRLIYAADKIRTATIIKFRKISITKDQQV